MLAVTSITFFFEADVKCGLYEIKQTQQSKCYTWTESGSNMFQDRTEAMLDQRGPGPGPSLVTVTEFPPPPQWLAVTEPTPPPRWCTLSVVFLCTVS